MEETNESAFAELAGRHRAELRLHCYRMLGSFEDAEDLVQETLLRAWSKRSSFEGRSTFRAWLYGIATNACLDALRARSRRVMPSDLGPPGDPTAEPLPFEEIPWLEPYPDRLLDEVQAPEARPDDRLIARETTELAFLAAIQHLPPRQRAVLIMRDVLGWSAAETAASLESTVVSVNSGLQRAHATLAKHLPRRDSDWLAGAPTNATEQELLAGMITAWERGDTDALAALLSEDARLVMPPTRSWFVGRDAVATFFAEHAFIRESRIERRAVAASANRQPAFGVYRRLPGEEAYTPFALGVLRIERRAIAEIALFISPRLFAAHGLAPAM
ncbi:MAG: polymerase sigma-70 factor, subfamily [Gaiellaceae bacterium]|nr:polymerase sigma-70 factor, subfamily [Gaiellaceae bacterium]